MRVVLGAMARTELESRAGQNLPAAVNAALLHYVRKLSAARGPAPYPRFLAEREAGDGSSPDARGPAAAQGHGAEVEVQHDDEVEALLVREAARQGVGMPELARHAVLVYLAELEAGGNRGPARLPQVGA